MLQRVCHIRTVNVSPVTIKIIEFQDATTLHSLWLWKPLKFLIPEEIGYILTGKNVLACVLISAVNQKKLLINRTFF